MSYCTPAELVLATGSTYSTDVLQALIDRADRQINARLLAARVSGSGNAVKEASLSLSISMLLTRMRMDGSKISTTSIDGTMNLTENVDAAIAGYEKRAWQLLDNYIAYAQPRKRFYIARSDRR
jgi:hypothetical protein